MKFKDGITEKHVIVRCGADKFLPFALTLGVYIILFGTVSPGGGFQGGVMVASAVLLLYLAYGYAGIMKAINPEVLRVNEAVGASLYVFLGLGGLLAGYNFCRNWIFDMGEVNTMLSAGTITFMGYAVGYKVLTGVGFLLILMLGMLAPEDDEEAVPARTEGTKAQALRAEARAQEVKAEALIAEAHTAQIKAGVLSHYADEAGDEDLPEAAPEAEENAADEAAEAEKEGSDK